MGDNNSCSIINHNTISPTMKHIVTDFITDMITETIPEMIREIIAYVRKKIIAQ